MAKQVNQIFNNSHNFIIIFNVSHINYIIVIIIEVSFSIIFNIVNHKYSHCNLITIY